MPILECLIQDSNIPLYYEIPSEVGQVMNTRRKKPWKRERVALFAIGLLTGPTKSVTYLSSKPLWAYSDHCQGITAIDQPEIFNNPGVTDQPKKDLIIQK